jgi:STE24 endopeptidase
VAQASEAEIVAVVGHELGHWKKQHTVVMALVGLILTYFQLYAFSYALAYAPMYQAFGFSAAPVLPGMLIFFSYAFQPISPLLSLGLNSMSRAFEFQADAFAVGLEHGDSLMTGLVRLSLENLSSQRHHSWYSAYHHSHPPLPQRLGAIQRLLQKGQ